MKTIMTALLIITLLTGQAYALPAGEKLSIIALNFPAYDFSRQIAGDRAEISMLLPPGTDAHSFEPSPKDLISLQKADLVIFNGGVGDYWVNEMLESLGDEAPATLVMMELVETVEEELIEGMEDVEHAHAQETPGEHPEHEEEGHEEEGHEVEARELDEHVWTAPKNAILISKAIMDTLSKLDPEGKSSYEQQYARYESELSKLDRDFKEMIQAAGSRTIVLGDRFPMRYFTREYGLAYYAAFPGCSAQTEPSAKTIAFLMDTIKEDKIPVVFFIEFSNQKAARLIAEETGAKALLLHSAHNVTRQELDNGVTYISIMADNLNNLREALN